MRLEIGNFHVTDIVFGDALSYKDGVLTINKEEALDFVREDARITEAELHIVRPGDMVRLCPALQKRVRILESRKRLVYEPTNSFYHC